MRIITSPQIYIYIELSPNIYYYQSITLYIMSTPTESTPTYLDQLPNEILNIISDYVVCNVVYEPNRYQQNPAASIRSLDNSENTWLNPAACIQGLYNAWPHSRYQALTKPYLHHGISFNGSASNLKHIIDGFLLEPETRLWARFLVFGYEKSLLYQSPFTSINEEFKWMTEACTNLGLKVEDMELPVMEVPFIIQELPDVNAELILWPYKRLEFLAQVLHRVTKFCYSTDGDWISPFPALYEKDLRTMLLPAVAPEWQSEDNNMMTEPASSTIITPVPSALRSVNQFYMGYSYWPSICQDPYQALLPAFFLPNIRVIQCSRIIPEFRNEDLTPLGPDAPHPYTSPITTLQFTSCDMRTTTFEKFLRLPKALLECSFRDSTHGRDCCKMSDMVQLLSNYHSKSLEILTLDGSEDTQKFGTVWIDGGDDISPERIGSLKHFENLRVIEVPLWSLVDCSGREKCNLPEILPASLEIIKLSFVMTVDYKCPQLCMETIKGHLKCMIEKKREMYPRLAMVEVYIRYITRREAQDLYCLYEYLEDSLAGLALQENVRLIIH